MRRVQSAGNIPDVNVDGKSTDADEGKSPFRLLMALFSGLKISLAYGLLGAGFLYFWGGKLEAQSFFMAYASSFKTLISLGLIIGTASIVYRSQDIIPTTIENAFKDTPLPDNYYFYKKSFAKRSLNMTLSAWFIVAAFAIFSFCQFPLPQPAESLMLIAACAEYGLGVYVGRKLLYTGLMLHSLLKITVTRNLFKKRELDDINWYVHIASTLTVIFTYITVIGYYDGPFKYHSIFGESIKPFLLLPAVVAMPVLVVFNFYPRAVLRKLYGESIEIEIKELRETVSGKNLSEFEKQSYILEVEKMSQDELRYSLQLTLGDLPIGITVLIMIIQPFVTR